MRTYCAFVVVIYDVVSSGNRSGIDGSPLGDTLSSESDRDERDELWAGEEGEERRRRRY